MVPRWTLEAPRCPRWTRKSLSIFGSSVHLGRRGLVDAGHSSRCGSESVPANHLQVRKFAHLSLRSGASVKIQQAALEGGRLPGRGLPRTGLSAGSDQHQLCVRARHDPLAPLPRGRRTGTQRRLCPERRKRHPSISEQSKAGDYGGKIGKSRSLGGTGGRGSGFDRGREGRMSSAPPPSEPDLQFSRIRLSS